jgi:hypothetical protein
MMPAAQSYPKKIDKNAEKTMITIDIFLTGRVLVGD